MSTHSPSALRMWYWVFWAAAGAGTKPAGFFPVKLDCNTPIFDLCGGFINSHEQSVYKSISLDVLAMTSMFLFTLELMFMQLTVVFTLFLYFIIIGFVGIDSPA